MEITSTISNVLQSLLAYPSATLVKKEIGAFINRTEGTGRLPEITLDEVADHDSYNDCWIVIYDRVYDVTDFLRSHPGGEDIIMEHAGRDATLAFHGTGHSKQAIEQLRDYLIGELPITQRIFRTANKRSSVLSSGIPE